MLIEIAQENRRASFSARASALNLNQALAPPPGEIHRRRWRPVLALLGALFENSRIVRLVGPNDRPLERHEFERPEIWNRHY